MMTGGLKRRMLKCGYSSIFKFTRDVMTSANLIACTNMRCQAVSSEVRRRLGRKDKYEVGEMLICRLYRNDEEGKFNVNIRWLITRVEGNMLTIQDIKDKDDVRTEVKILETNTLDMLTVLPATLVKDNQ